MGIIKELYADNMAYKTRKQIISYALWKAYSRAVFAAVQHLPEKSAERMAEESNGGIPTDEFYLYILSFAVSSTVCPRCVWYGVYSEVIERTLS